MISARSKIEGLKGAINDMRMKQAMAEIHEMSAGMVATLGGSGDTLNRLTEMVEEERTKAAGRARVARDALDMGEVKVKEAEMNALADQALADFAAREGISLPGAEAAPPAPRTMGPRRHAGDASNRRLKTKAPEMPAPQGAPEWAAELSLAFESGASGQFILYGNVHDRLAVGGRLVNIERYIQDELLAGFAVVFAYDLGNGLTVERGGERLAQWLPVAAQPAARAAGSHPLRQPLRALSGQPERARARRQRAGGHDRPRRRPASAGRRQWLRARQPHEPRARVGLGRAVHPDSVRESPDRGQPQRSGAARRVLAACRAGARSAAFGAGVAGGPHAAAETVSPDDSAGNEHARARRRHHRRVRQRARAAREDARAQQAVLQASDLAPMKKQMVERDAPGLVEFVDSEAHARRLPRPGSPEEMAAAGRALWSASDLKALPMGYLLCGPIGTGKTFLVECLAGEAGVPVVKLKNFRDNWVGSSEGNLEKIFRLIRALGRCIVFIDEADQTLGRRDSGAGDSGLSGRLYSMIAQEMADTGNRGKVVWILASSRPDLIEVDLKRPGRVDVKVPLLPTTTRAESAGLIGGAGAPLWAGAHAGRAEAA